jgi:hypothetical protein
MLAAVLALAVPLGGQGEKPQPPKPVERDGLAVTIKPAEKAFATGKPLTFEVTFMNVSDDPIRLPDRAQNLNAWEFHLSRADVKKSYTGHSITPPSKTARPTPSAPILPGESLAVTVRLDYTFAFSEGAWDPKKTFRQLPEGRYRLRAEINYPGRPRADKNPARLWGGAPLLTRPADFVVGEPDSGDAKEQAMNDPPRRQGRQEDN